MREEKAKSATPSANSENAPPRGRIRPMSSPPRRKSITESPWYWVCLFCTAGLVALVLVGPKFEARQAQIERQYQGRERAAQQRAGQSPSTPMSMAGDTYISLWPLQVALAVLLAASWPVLWWRHFRRRSEAGATDSKSPVKVEAYAQAAAGEGANS